MRQETRDIAVQTVVSAPTSLYAIASGLSVAEWVAILLGVLQALYLLRKWWREETEWGIKLKRWAEKHGLKKTGPTPLDDE